MTFSAQLEEDVRSEDQKKLGHPDRSRKARDRVMTTFWYFVSENALNARPLTAVQNV